MRMTTARGRARPAVGARHRCNRLARGGVQGGVQAGGARRPSRSTRTRSPTCWSELPRKAAQCPGADHLGARARRRLRALRGRRVAGHGAGPGGRAPGDQDLHGARPGRPVGVGAAQPHPARLRRGGALGDRVLVRRPARPRAHRPPPLCRRRAAVPGARRRARSHPPRAPAPRRGGRRPGPPARLPAGAAVGPRLRSGDTRARRRRPRPSSSAGSTRSTSRTSRSAWCSSRATTSSTSTPPRWPPGSNGPCGAAACYTAAAAADLRRPRRSSATTRSPARILGAGEL